MSGVRYSVTMGGNSSFDGARLLGGANALKLLTVLWIRRGGKNRQERQERQEVLGVLGALGGSFLLRRRERGRGRDRLQGRLPRGARRLRLGGARGPLGRRGLRRLLPRRKPEVGEDRKSVV